MQRGRRSGMEAQQRVLHVTEQKEIKVSFSKVEAQQRVLYIVEMRRPKGWKRWRMCKSGKVRVYQRFALAYLLVCERYGFALSNVWFRAVKAYVWLSVSLLGDCRQGGLALFEGWLRAGVRPFQCVKRQWGVCLTAAQARHRQGVESQFAGHHRQSVFRWAAACRPPRANRCRG